MKFERAIVTALSTLPKGCWQRIDGLMCESAVLNLPWYAKLFSEARLSLMALRGIIEIRAVGSMWPSCDDMLSFRLAHHIRVTLELTNEDERDER
jgi:hypothetical protein